MKQHGFGHVVHGGGVTDADLLRGFAWTMGAAAVGALVGHFVAPVGHALTTPLLRGHH